MEADHPAERCIRVRGYHVVLLPRTRGKGYKTHSMCSALLTSSGETTSVLGSGQSAGTNAVRPDRA
eukprot:3618627-Prymnesium_polylepis.1